MRHPLLRGTWIPKHLFALAIFGTMIWLGLWQLDRLEQRRAANAARQAVLDQNPVTVMAESSPEALVGRRVRLTGTFRNDEAVLLRGQRSDSGVNGAHLIVPLALSGADQAVLVDRGWIPANQDLEAARTAYTVSGEVTIEGIALAGQVRPDSPLAPRDLPLPGTAEIEAWVRVDIAGIQGQVAAPLLNYYVEQLPGAAGGATLPRPRDPRQLDEGPHLGYALQWFAFSAMMAVVYAALMRQELQRYERGA